MNTNNQITVSQPEIDGQEIQRKGVLISLAIIFFSTGLVLIQPNLIFVGMYFGLTVFFVSQLATSRVSEKAAMISPEQATFGIVAALCLFITAVVAVF